MLRHERRLLIDCLGIGIALTLFVIAADATGMLGGLEDILYDLRAQLCQHFTPRPTDTLVHLDIDDAATETIGWPLPRASLARILDEVHLAGPKAVEMDVLLSEPQPIQLVETSDQAMATHPTTHPAAAAVPAAHPTTTAATSQAAPAASLPVARIDHDAELADSIRRSGNILLPASFIPVPQYTPLVAAMIDELRKDLELDYPVVMQRLRARGVEGAGVAMAAAAATSAAAPAPAAKDAHVDDFLAARREAMELRLRELAPDPQTPFDDVRLRLLPRTPIEITTAAVNVLRMQWNRYLVAREFRRFSSPTPPGMQVYAPMRVAIAPLRQFSAAAAGGSFADYPRFGSPVIRSLPALLEVDGKVYPQMGLALACRMLDADLGRARIDGSNLTIPRPPGSPDLVIPLAPSRVSTTGARYAHIMWIPWFGGRQWEYMYDWPARRSSAQHLPLNKVWEVVAARDKIIRNNRQVDDAIRGFYQEMNDTRRFDEYNSHIPSEEDVATREKVARGLLQEFQPFFEEFQQMKPQEMDEKQQKVFASLKALRNSLDLNPDLVAQLTNFRAALHQQLNGKAILLGWTATAAIADFVPTSLHDKCPGSVVHGVVYNGIMTGEMWRTAPWWITALSTFFLGSLVSFITARFNPLKALLIALAVACAFALVNGTLLFDKCNIILGAAAPLVAIGGAWAACTLTRVIIEAAERTRITRRFSNYVDPKLVSHVMEDPNAKFDGERREMTVVFTDLAGFTTLSEKLGERIVPLLNELLGELVPVIRDHHQGYVNKFLGDGIMFFFNAPRRMEKHAVEAVATVTDMHDKLAEFNVRLRERGLPEISMRASVMTGEMIVGDAGWAGEQSDYTVLGDTVNTGARLEAANKAVGTRTLISARTAEMLNGEFLIRPVGKLKVVGKDEAVMVYEPLAFSSRATDEQRELAKCTAELVESFVQRRFADTLALAGTHEIRFGKSKLVTVYRILAEQFLASPPEENFDGRIVLTEK